LRNGDGTAVLPNEAIEPDQTTTKGFSMKLSRITFVLVAACGLLGACASNETYSNDGPTYLARTTDVQRIEYGVVEHIDLFREGSSAPTGLGAVLGGVAGGVIGHQFGGGAGNALATFAGAVGGALVGNNIQHANASDRYRVSVRLDSGARIELTEVGEGELRVGDRVRVVNNRVYRA
jgi:outer membrane lipoprotein SlyB